MNISKFILLLVCCPFGSPFRSQFNGRPENVRNLAKLATFGFLSFFKPLFPRFEHFKATGKSQINLESWGDGKVWTFKTCLWQVTDLNDHFVVFKKSLLSLKSSTYRMSH